MKKIILLLAALAIASTVSAKGFDYRDSPMPEVALHLMTDIGEDIYNQKATGVSSAALLEEADRLSEVTWKLLDVISYSELVRRIDEANLTDSDKGYSKAVAGYIYRVKTAGNRKQVAKNIVIRAVRFSIKSYNSGITFGEFRKIVNEGE